MALSNGLELGVQEEVERRRDGLLLVASFALVAICGSSAGGRVSPASNASGLVVQDLLRLGLSVGRDVERDLVEVPRPGRHGIFIAANLGFLTREYGPVRRDVGDHVRADAGGQIRPTVLRRQALRHDAQRREREHVAERAVRVSSVILISPVASSVSMPEIDLALPLSKSRAPLT
jgi:hypothetical protein